MNKGKVYNSTGRLSLPKESYHNYNESEFDKELSESVQTLMRTCPHEWETVLQYLRTMAIPLTISADRKDEVTAEFHRKAYVTSIVKRLIGLESA